MATGWVKAFRCKTNAIEDVYHKPPLKPSTPRKNSSSPSSSSSSSSPSNPTMNSPSKLSKPPLLLPLGCGNTSHHLKDIIILKKQRKPKTKTKAKTKPNSDTKIPISAKPKSKSQPFPPQSELRPKPTSQNLSFLPTLLPLPPDHSSRRVVEIIFTSSWASPAAASPLPPKFAGEIEMLCRIQNPSRTVARFEEYRDLVRFRAGHGSSRCAADGNEMMRFRPAPASFGTVVPDETICGAGFAWPSAGEGGIRTFAGSGGAHAGGSGGVGQRKRKAMVVCRVIAGRIRNGYGSQPDPVKYESVSVRKGELVVFDLRAVLPCFLIIYRT